MFTIEKMSYMILFFHACMHQNFQNAEQKYIVAQIVKLRKIKKMAKIEILFKNSHDLNIIQQKYNTVEKKIMSLENIFLDQETYLKRNLSIDQLFNLVDKEDSKEIARFFISKDNDMGGLKEAISHQIDKVIEIMPVKHKQIFKNKFSRLSIQKKSKNGKFQQSVKDSHACSTNTQAEHELIDFFEDRYNTLSKYH